MSIEKYEKLWIKGPDQEEINRAIRNDLIVKLANDKIGYGDLSHRDVAFILGITQPSVSRVLKNGRNISKPVIVS